MPAPALAPAHPSEDAKDEEEPWDDLLEEGMHGPWDEPPDDEGFCEWDDWGDEEEKVKIYIETNQFKGTVTKEMVDVDFEEYLCDVRVTDEEGNVYIRNFYK